MRARAYSTSRRRVRIGPTSLLTIVWSIQSSRSRDGPCLALPRLALRSASLRGARGRVVLSRLLCVLAFFITSGSLR
eukprot:2591091-Prymnesium_polylepis.1